MVPSYTHAILDLQVVRLKRIWQLRYHMIWNYQTSEVSDRWVLGLEICRTSGMFNFIELSDIWHVEQVSGPLSSNYFQNLTVLIFFFLLYYRWVENKVLSDNLIELWPSLKKIVWYWNKLPKSKQPKSKSY